jgi:hypothetical protein
MASQPLPDNPPGTLDPADWAGFRLQARRILDDILDYVENIRDRPVHAEFMRYILPFAGGNVHPAFIGWVQGAGTPLGLLA